MALSDPYASPAQYRSTIGKSDAADDNQLLAHLSAVSRHIDGKLGRFFGQDVAAVARRYLVPVTIPPTTASGLWLTRAVTLPIDDLAAAPTSVTVAGVALLASEYDLLPWNAPLGPEPQPYTHLALTSGTFLAGQTVTVTGKFGWPAVPAVIREATIQLTALLRLETPRATSRISELDGTIQASPQAQGIIRDLLASYKRFYLA